MRHSASPHRPAIAAIAAVLALQTMSAAAQTTDPAAPPAADPAPSPTIVAPPVLAPVPTTPAPSASSPQVIYQANSPVVQQVPATPAPVVADEPAPSATSTAQASTVKSSAAATAPAQKASVQQPEARNPATVAVPPAVPAPVEMTDTTAQTSTPAPQIAAAEEDDGTEAGYWILGLGAALLAGAGAYAAMRRRSTSEVAVAQPETMYGYKPVVEQEKASEPFVAVSNPADRYKTTEPELLLARNERINEAAEPTHSVEVPVVETQEPMPASMETNTAPVAPRVTGDLASRREAMIADAPSAANPFLTRKNRLRRANFILAKQGESVVDAPSAAVADREVAIEKQRDPVQVSYAFGKGSLRAPVLKPRYN